MSKKLILVIGGTGAQGLPVIKSLLSSNQTTRGDSPYAVRVLTRDPNNHRSEQLKALGCEVVKGSLKDLPSVHSALQGAYGAFVNTDGFTIGEKEETFVGLRIYEMARELGVKHYVWSNLDYMSKKGKFNPRYRCGHYDAKGRVSDFLKAQESAKSPADGTVWSILTSGPYMDMLWDGLFPPKQNEDGSVHWSLPLASGHVPLIALSDFGVFARYIFDNPEANSGVDLEIASQMATGYDIAQAFEKVTGKKAVYEDIPLDAYFSRFGGGNHPAAREAPDGMTFKDNFTGFFNAWHDDLVTRDMDALKKIHPGLHTLESWMKEVGYDGTPKSLLKNLEDGRARQAAGHSKI